MASYDPWTSQVPRDLARSCRAFQLMTCRRKIGAYIPKRETGTDTADDWPHPRIRASADTVITKPRFPSYTGLAFKIYLPQYIKWVKIGYWCWLDAFNGFQFSRVHWKQCNTLRQILIFSITDCASPHYLSTRSQRPILRINGFMQPSLNPLLFSNVTWLGRLLPSLIQVMAWCPVSTGQLFEPMLIHS